MTNGGVAGFPGAGQDAKYMPKGASWPLGYLHSGFYYFTTSAASASASSTLGVGVLRLNPWVVPNACTLSRIGTAVTSAGEGGSLFRLGIYADDGTGYPGFLVLDAGTINGASNTVQEITINQALAPGLYWVGGAVQNVSVTQPTIATALNSSPVCIPAGLTAPTSAGVNLGVGQNSVTGAFPAQLSQSLLAAGSVARVFVKIA